MVKEVCDVHRKDEKRRYARFCCSLILTLFVVLVLLTVLIIWLVLRPTKPRFSLQDASVYQFNLSSTSPYLLNSTLQVTISSRNPNDRIGVYYDRLDVYAVYKFQQVTLPTSIDPQYQGHHDVTVWSPFLYGAAVPISPSLCQAIVQDGAAGLMLLSVKVSGKVRWKVGTWTSGHYHLDVNCPAFLTFSHGAGAGGEWNGAFLPVIRFQHVTRCSVDV